MRARAVGGLVLMVMVLAAACGGEEEISKDEYLKRAKEICDQGNKDLEKATDEAFANIKEGETPSEERIQDYARTIVVPMVRRQVQDLRNLPKPKGAADQVDEIYDAVEETLDKIEADPDLLLNSQGLFKEADDLAKKYGYEVCT